MLERKLTIVLWDREWHLLFPGTGGPAWFEGAVVLSNQVVGRYGALKFMG